MTSMLDIRNQNVSILNVNGFLPAATLPLLPEPGSIPEVPQIGGVLRPIQEIAQRYMALVGVFAWATGPDEFAEILEEFLHRNKLAEAMTASELEIVESPKNAAVINFQGSVGWRLENMWPLAWSLGLASPPSPLESQISGDLVREMMGMFMPDFSATVDFLVSQSQLQTNEDVVAMHDLFYCAHNAVRGAQLGNETVPEFYDPIGDGGTVHERRHSLSWMLSPGTDWEQVDLST